MSNEFIIDELVCIVEELREIGSELNEHAIAAYEAEYYTNNTISKENTVTEDTGIKDFSKKVMNAIKKLIIKLKTLFSKTITALVKFFTAVDKRFDNLVKNIDKTFKDTATINGFTLDVDNFRSLIIRAAMSGDDQISITYNNNKVTIYVDGIDPSQLVNNAVTVLDKRVMLMDSTLTIIKKSIPDDRELALKSFRELTKEMDNSNKIISVMNEPDTIMVGERFFVKNSKGELSELNIKIDVIGTVYGINNSDLIKSLAKEAKKSYNDLMSSLKKIDKEFNIQYKRMLDNIPEDSVDMMSIVLSNVYRVLANNISSITKDAIVVYKDYLKLLNMSYYELLKKTR